MVQVPLSEVESGLPVREDETEFPVVDRVLAPGFLVEVRAALEPLVVAQGPVGSQVATE